MPSFAGRHLDHTFTDYLAFFLALVAPLSSHLPKFRTLNSFDHPRASDLNLWPSPNEPECLDAVLRYLQSDQKGTALSLSKEIASDKAKQQAAEVSLPRYVWEKGDYQETSDYCYPEGQRDGYWEYKNPKFGSHYGERPTQGKDSPRGTNGYGKGRCQKHE